MIRRIARAHLWIAAVLAAITVCTGLIWSTRVAAGADAYGYVSQVDLWLHGDLHIDQGRQHPLLRRPAHPPMGRR